MVNTLTYLAARSVAISIRKLSCIYRLNIPDLCKDIIFDYYQKYIVRQSKIIQYKTVELDTMCTIQHEDLFDFNLDLGDIFNDWLTLDRGYKYDYKEFFYARTVQDKLNILYLCDCCERHQKDKPISVCTYEESECTNNYFEDYVCKCNCRHLSRVICRNFNNLN